MSFELPDLHQKRIYESVISYETSIIYGTLSRLIFQANQISSEEIQIIKGLFDKVRSSHIKTERLRPIAKAIKMCLHTNQDVCYANLVKSKDFSLVIKDEDSFLVIVANQIIPTIDDIKLFSHLISSSAPQESSILDVALSSKDVEEIFPGLSGVVESISLLKKTTEDLDDNRFITGKEIVDAYDAYIKRLEEGLAFYSTGFEALDRNLVEGFAPGQVTILAARAGMGKCFGKGTKVLMFNGELKSVETVKTGELVMGPDSKPRRVLGTTSGTGDLYLVSQTTAEDYVVNGDHILSLKCSQDYGSEKKGDIINISVDEYLTRNPRFKSRYAGYKVGVDFPKVDLTIDPYFLGIWLGDGTSRGVRVTNPDKEIIEYLSGYAAKLGLTMNTYKGITHAITQGKGGKGKLKGLQTILKSENLLGNKHIPKKYLINSQENRLQLLAGILDSDGHYAGRLGFEVTQKNKGLAEQIKFLADSLGFKTSLIEKTAKITSIGFSCQVFRVRIYGNLEIIPCKVARKKATPYSRRYPHENTGIKISSIGRGKYYGFEVSGDHLFLLKDCTVTHNSAMLTNIMKNLFMRKIHIAQYVLEMDKISFTHRLVSSISGIDLDKITRYRDQLTTSERSTLDTVRQIIIDNPYLHLNDKPAPSIDAIKQGVIKLQKKVGHKNIIVAIDLFDKVSNVMMASNNMQANFHIALTQIQIAAKELGVHFILVAQINRDNEKKTDKRPTLVNLKHSGAFEEVADIILFIDRPAYRMLEEDLGGIEGENVAPVFGNDNEFQTFDSFSKTQLEHNSFFENPDSVTQESLGQDPKFNKDKKVTDALKQKKLVRAGGLVVPIEQYAEVIIAKQRRGPANKVIPFIFHGATSTFTSVKLISPVIG